MDGLLIDSEPFWQEAEIIALSRVGVSIDILDCQKTMGLRVDEAVDFWYKQFPWQNLSKKEVEELMMENVMRLVQEKGAAKPGVKYALDFLKAKGIKIAVASSSHMRIIKQVVEKMNIGRYFDELHSAEFEEHGKPHPGVYLTAAKKLDVPTQNCISFEAVKASFCGTFSYQRAYDY